MKKLLLLSLTLIFINNLSYSQELNIPLLITDGFASDTLYFGIDPIATNGLDNILGEDELPPLPPTGVFDARFTGEGLIPSVPIGEGLKNDYRNGTTHDTTFHKYRLKYKVGVGSTILIRWSLLPIGVKGNLNDIITGTIINKSLISGPDSLLITIPSGISILELSVKYEYPQPVELISFTSVVNENNVRLEWSTSQETQNEGFDLERKKVDDPNWTKIGFVNGFINSNNVQHYQYSDKNLLKGKYNYRLKQIDLNGNFEYFNLNEIVEVGIPANIYLSQNYPNPFNPVTTINYNLPIDSYVRLSLFDVNGKNIKNISEGFQSSGYYEVNFNSEGISSGTYYYKLESSAGSITKKMMILK